MQQSARDNFRALVIGIVLTQYTGTALLIRIHYVKKPLAGALPGGVPAARVLATAYDSVVIAQLGNQQAVAIHLIDHPMFFVDAPRPIAG